MEDKGQEKLDKAVKYLNKDTVCCLTLQNGFNVVGTSAPASPDNFNAEIGQSIARGKAVEQIWQLEGYLLKYKLKEGKI